MKLDILLIIQKSIKRDMQYKHVLNTLVNCHICKHKTVTNNCQIFKGHRKIKLRILVPKIVMIRD